MKRFLFLLIVFAMLHTVEFSAQQMSKTDSLVLSLEKTPEAEKPAILNNIARDYLNVDVELAEKYANESVRVARKTGDKKEEASALNLLSILSKRKGDLDTALKRVKESLAIREEIDDKKGIAGCLTNIGDIYAERFDFSAAIESMKSSYEINLELDNKAGAAIALFNIGKTYYRWSNFEEAINYNQQALRIFEEIGHQAGIESCYNSLGQIHETFRNFESALNSYERALAFAEESGNVFGMADAYNNIGNVYSKMNEQEKALEYYTLALEKSREVGYKQRESSALNNLAVGYYNLEDHQKALKYFQEALAISKELGNLYEIANNLHGMAKVYGLLQQHNQALKLLSEALEVAQKANLLTIIRDIYGDFSGVYEGTGDFKKSLAYYKMSAVLGDSIFQADAHKQFQELNAIYQNEKNQQQIQLLNTERELQVLEIQKKNEEVKRQKITIYFFITGFILVLIFTVLLLRLYNQKKKANILLAEQKREIEMKNLELEKLSIVASETDNAVLITDDTGEIEWVNAGFNKLYEMTIDELKDSRGSNIMNSSFNPEITEILKKAIANKQSVVYNSECEKKNGTSIWVQTTFTPIFEASGKLRKIMAINSDITRIKEAEVEIIKQKNLVELKNLHIMDSIRYAMRIQEAMLPPRSFVKALLPESFLLYKPKDIVSGDFYWVAEIENKVLMSAVDCTGHGVPGAFVSIVGMNTLNQAVNEAKLSDPAKILDFLSKKINETLRKNQSDDSAVKDGMDLGLCALNKETLELEFAGVHNPMYVLRGDEVIQLKPEKHPIGDPLDEEFQGYSNTLIQLEKNDVLYLFSDGFVDQFGGPKRKKYLSKRFRETLIEMKDTPIKEQESKLFEIFEAWRGDVEQYDDVTILGVKIAH